MTPTIYLSVSAGKWRACHGADQICADTDKATAVDVMRRHLGDRLGIDRDQLVPVWDGNTGEWRRGETIRL